MTLTYNQSFQRGSRWGLADVAPKKCNEESEIRAELVPQLGVSEVVTTMLGARKRGGGEKAGIGYDHFLALGKLWEHYLRHSSCSSSSATAPELTAWLRVDLRVRVVLLYTTTLSVCRPALGCRWILLGCGSIQRVGSPAYRAVRTASSHSGGEFTLFYAIDHVEMDLAVSGNTIC